MLDSDDKLNNCIICTLNSVLCALVSIKAEHLQPHYHSTNLEEENQS